MYRFLKTVIFTILFSTLCYGQDEDVVVYDDSEVVIQEINEEDLATYKSDKDFIYTEVIEEETVFDRIWRWFQNLLRDFFEWLFGVESATGILKFIFNVLPYIILGLLVFLLIKFFLNVNSNTIVSGKTNKGTVEFTGDEQIIKNEDINALINNAIKQKNYRLAIRYYYLLSLKYLSEKQLIDWLPQKTNEDYIREIEKDTLRTDFMDATRIYDYVWYGEFAIDELKFHSLKSSFEAFNNTIQTP